MTEESRDTVWLLLLPSVQTRWSCRRQAQRWSRVPSLMWGVQCAPRVQVRRLQWIWFSSICSSCVSPLWAVSLIAWLPQIHISSPDCTPRVQSTALIAFWPSLDVPLASATKFVQNWPYQQMNIYRIQLNFPAKLLERVISSTLSLFVDNMIVYLKHPRESTEKSLELIRVQTPSWIPDEYIKINRFSVYQ